MNTKAKARNHNSKLRFEYHPDRARPKGREAVPVQISRLLMAHEIILQAARASARKAAYLGDDGTNDLLVSNVIRTNEMQVWFLAEHLV